MTIRSFTFPSLSGAAVAKQDGVGAMFDQDAIVAALQSAITESVVEDAGLDGAIGGAVCLPWRGLTVTTASSPATYNTSDPIVVLAEVTIQGKLVEVTLAATLTQAGGSETLDFEGPFERIKSITIPAQLGTGGSFDFGVGDVYSKRGLGKAGEDFKYLVGLGTGNLKVGYANGQVDLIPTVAGRKHDVTPWKIFRNGTTSIFSIGA